MELVSFRGWFSLLIVFCAFNQGIVSQQRWFIGPEGNSEEGTEVNPWSLNYAKNASQVSAGDTVFILEGVYPSNNTEITWKGAPDAPIIFKPYNNGKVILKGTATGISNSWSVLRINGTFIHVYDLIITCSARNRTSSQQSTYPTDVTTQSGVVLRDPGSKFINGIVHNVLSTSLNSPGTATDGEYYGNICFHNGWMEISNNGDRYFGHGHSLYFQNDEGSRKTIDNNIFLKNYGYGIQFYSYAGSPTEGSDIVRNITFMSNTLGSIGAVNGGYNYLIDSNSGTIMDKNYSYHFKDGDGYSIGYNRVGDEIKFTNNYSQGEDAFIMKNFSNVIGYGNVSVNTNGGTMASIQLNQEKPYEPWLFNYDWDRNTYYGVESFSKYQNDYNSFFSSGGNFTDFIKDNSVDDLSKVLPLESAPNRVDLFPNAYEARRAHIVICNHELLDSVSVDVSSVFERGDEYWLYDVEDMNQSIKHGRYQGGIINIATNQTSCFPLYGNNLYAQPVHSGNDFGAFLIVGREIDIVEGEKPAPECEIEILEVSTSGDHQLVNLKYELLGNCTDPVQISIRDAQGAVFYTDEDYVSGTNINIAEECPRCDTGEFIASLSTTGYEVSDLFVYKKSDILNITSYYPNPTVDLLGVTFQAGSNADLTFSIVDEFGNVVDSENVNTSDIPKNKLGDFKFAINLEPYEVGRYTIIIEGENSKDSCKVILQGFNVE